MAEDYHAKRPLFGGAIASTFPLRFQGMCTVTISASVPALKPAECVGSICPSATTAQEDEIDDIQKLLHSKCDELID
ncbi:Protein NRT1/ PTR FAMILY 8.3 [Camellia lanceoleosa]|nr:Protein NRT1/ PTR FAMILY 8.3 [Camellia lanceoleosa]